jgi:formate C-acetyltransferase
MKDYKRLKEYILTKKHRALRRKVEDDLPAIYSSLGLSAEERMTRRFEYLCAHETPVVLSDERIAFLRTLCDVPHIYTEEEFAALKSEKRLHELGFHSNVTPDYEKLLRHGLLYFRDSTDDYGARCIDALISLCDRYVDEARKVGNDEVASTLEHVSRYGATSFLEALQLFRIIHFALWLEGNYHVTVGRFDKYMYPYFKSDLDSGKLTLDEAAMLVEEFFLSFNRDSDLYPGVQQGDNGQSLVLGGKDENGCEIFNELSRLCLEASGRLMVIDPKINLRVSKDTPLEVFMLGTQLTKKGLGFPQYTNDDVAIPALIDLGYEPADAANYGMAACWELIVSGVGMDTANIDALSFAKIVDRALHEDLITCDTMEEFNAAIRAQINKEIDVICKGTDGLWFIPSPFLRICMNENADGSYKYNNFGIHGTGACTAADSLAAIEKYIFDERSLTKEELIAAVDSDFSGAPELLHKLRYETAKVGQNDDYADKYLCMLLSFFADSLEGKRNCLGGIYRAGTGSAMFYLQHVENIGASPDGRRRGESLGANFSVSLFAKTGGPLSVISSLTKPELHRTINGGPVTLEFASGIWSAEDSIEKFSKFIKSYIAMGGHQIQLNSVDLATLKRAQEHPEDYERLVVRIWGWSAYFTALDKCYQDHVMQRQIYSM